MDNYDINNFGKLVHFQMRMLQAEVTMQAMIAENKQREFLGESVAYGESAFNNLINEYHIGYNDFPDLRR